MLLLPLIRGPKREDSGVTRRELCQCDWFWPATRLDAALIVLSALSGTIPLCNLTNAAEALPRGHRGRWPAPELSPHTNNSPHVSAFNQAYILPLVASRHFRLCHLPESWYLFRSDISH